MENTHRYRVRAVLALLAVTVPLLLAGGCASSATHPGAANTVDSQIYDSLLSAQAAIEQAKSDFGADPAVKPALNRVIASYNAAMDAYVSYHQLAVSGKQLDPSTLQAQVAALTADIVALQKTFKAKKGGTP